ncbi:MAG: hypothetical protein MHPSP_003108, partial [Paramarteilia canceri]
MVAEENSMSDNISEKELSENSQAFSSDEDKVSDEELFLVEQPSIATKDDKKVDGADEELNLTVKLTNGQQIIMLAKASEDPSNFRARLEAKI